MWWHIKLRFDHRLLSNFMSRGFGYTQTQQIGFGAYKREFEENRTTGKLLLSLTKLDLKALSISKLGHRLRYSSLAS